MSIPQTEYGGQHIARCSTVWRHSKQGKANPTLVASLHHALMLQLAISELRLDPCHIPIQFEASYLCGDVGMWGHGWCKHCAQRATLDGPDASGCCACSFGEVQHTAHPPSCQTPFRVVKLLMHTLNSMR